MTPIYKCGYKLIYTINITSRDINSNRKKKNEVVTVDDSSRKGIRRDQYLEKPCEKFVDNKIWEGLIFSSCKAIGVYVHPHGHSNFISLDNSQVPYFNVWIGEENWQIPKK